MIGAVALFLNAMFYFPLLFTHNSKAAVALPTIAIIFDVFARVGLGLVGKLHTRREVSRGSKDNILLPAFNLDLLMERTTQFVVVVVGEFIILSSYVASESQVGAHGEFGRSALSIVIALCLVRCP